MTNWLVKGRRTAKLLAAISHAKAIGITPTHDRDELYTAIESKGYYWSAKTGTWDMSNPQTGSVFEDHNGDPSGRFKMRVMAHPQDLEYIEDILTDVLMDYGLRVWNDNPDKTYNNRHGAGVRVYLEGQLLPKDED